MREKNPLRKPSSQTVWETPDRPLNIKCIFGDRFAGKVDGLRTSYHPKSYDLFVHTYMGWKGWRINYAKKGTGSRALNLIFNKFIFSPPV